MSGVDWLTRFGLLTAFGGECLREQGWFRLWMLRKRGARLQINQCDQDQLQYALTTWSDTLASSVISKFSTTTAMTISMSVHCTRMMNIIQKGIASTGSISPMSHTYHSLPLNPWQAYNIAITEQLMSMVVCFKSHRPPDDINEEVLMSR